jgi:hypothetical protein
MALLPEALCDDIGDHMIEFGLRFCAGLVKLKASNNPPSTDCKTGIERQLNVCLSTAWKC